jgi:periplasmic protein TonB
VTSQAVVAQESKYLGGPLMRVWCAAVLAAAVLHGGCFGYAFLASKHDDADVALGAPAVEIGLDMTAPHAEDENLPPGPESEAAAASAASASQEAKAEQTDQPKAQPTETENPDQVVSPDASKKEKPDDPKLKEAKSNPSAESVASEATAPPKVEAAREALKSVAPAQGTGESAQRIKATWQKELVAHLNRFKRYPASTTAQGMTIVVSFTLDRLGHVAASKVVQSSGSPAFDQAALAMMTRADPVPSPPAVVADEGLTFTIPVIFRGRKK